MTDGTEPQAWSDARIREAFIFDGGQAEYYDPINGAAENRRVSGAIFDTWLAAHDADLRNAARRRFDPDNDALRESLAWHSRITVELQRRVQNAQEYVSRHGGDIGLQAILSGDERTTRLFRGVDTYALSALEAARDPS